MLPTQRLDGRHAIVTGAGRGIGRAVALALAEAGADVTLFSRSEAELDAVAAEVARARPAAETCVGDVRSPERRRTARRDGRRQRRPLDLRHGGGLNRPGPTLEQPIEDFDLIVDTNLRGTYLTCRAFAPRSRGREGRIVAISSQMGEVGYPGRAAYCASKHAVNGLVRALAVEWAPQITVNAVAPTFIETPLTRPMLADEAFRADVLRRMPMGRIGTPSDVVGAVVFLASTRPRW